MGWMDEYNPNFYSQSIVDWGQDADKTPQYSEDILPSFGGGGGIPSTPQTSSWGTPYTGFNNFGDMGGFSTLQDTTPTPYAGFRGAFGGDIGTETGFRQPWEGFKTSNMPGMPAPQTFAVDPRLTPNFGIPGGGRGFTQPPRPSTGGGVGGRGRRTGTIAQPAATMRRLPGSRGGGIPAEKTPEEKAADKTRLFNLFESQHAMPTYTAPRFEAPEWDEEARRGYIREAYTPYVGELRSAIRDAIAKAGYSTSPTARKFAMEGALKGFGEQLGPTRGRAVQEGSRTYEKKHEKEWDAALMKHQTNLAEVKANYSSAMNRWKALFNVYMGGK